eukprot:scaffold843_cov255-Pinguiococcus_pyrenoidosus.AAC.13
MADGEPRGSLPEHPSELRTINFSLSLSFSLSQANSTASTLAKLLARESKRVQELWSVSSNVHSVVEDQWRGPGAGGRGSQRTLEMDSQAELLQEAKSIRASSEEERTETVGERHSKGLLSTLFVARMIITKVLSCFRFLLSNAELRTDFLACGLLDVMRDAFHVLSVLTNGEEVEAIGLDVQVLIMDTLCAVRSELEEGFVTRFLPLCVDLVKSPRWMRKQSAAKFMASCVTSDQQRRRLGDDGVVACLVDLVESMPADMLEDTCGALINLLIDVDNAWEFWELGGGEIISGHMHSSNVVVHNSAIMILKIVIIFFPNAAYEQIPERCFDYAWRRDKPVTSRGVAQVGAPNVFKAIEEEVLRRRKAQDYLDAGQLEEQFASDRLHLLKEAYKVHDEFAIGLIDDENFLGLLKDLGVHVEEQVALSILDDFDTDGNGLLDFGEFLEMILKLDEYLQKNSLGRFVFKASRSSAAARTRQAVGAIESPVSDCGERMSHGGQQNGLSGGTWLKRWSAMVATGTKSSGGGA